MKSRKTFKQIVIFSAVIIYFLLFAVLIWHNRQLFNYFSLPLFTVLFITSVLAIGCIGMINYYLFKPSINSIAPKEGIKFAVLNIIGNYLPLSAGLLGKGIYLNKRYNLGYKKYAGLSLFMLLIQFSISGWVGVLAVYQLNITDVEIQLLFVALGLCPIIIILIPVIRTVMPNSSILSDSIYSLKEILNKSLFWLCVWQLAYLFFQAWILVLSLRSIGYDAGYLQAMIYSCGIALTRLVNVLPGAIGTREGIVLYLGIYTGLGLKEAILGVGLARIATIIVVFLWGILQYGNDVKKMIKSI